MKPRFSKIRILSLLLLFLVVGASAQNDQKIAEQRKAIAALEKKIAAEEAQISKLKKGRATTEERARRLARQIESRNQLITENEREAALLREEIVRTNGVADSLQQALDKNREQYRLLAREAYRNYRQNNYLSYLFSSSDFTQMARRLAALREMAALRERKLKHISELQGEVSAEREKLDGQKRSLDSVTRRATNQRERLKRDASAAKKEIKNLSQREKRALQRKMEQEQQLSVAISELRKLTRGNKEGASFSAGTSGLNLPVAHGKVKRYKGNMAEITGPKGAAVRSIYEGKVVEIKQNRITAKYDVFVAHGEYITSYANMGTVAVKKEQKVAKNQPLGTVGASVNATTMDTEYKIVFGIYSPNPKEEMSAAQCFKK